MGKDLLRSLGAAFALLMGVAMLAPPVVEYLPQQPKTGGAHPQKRISKRDRIDLAMAQEVEMTKDPRLGIVPTERLQAAREYAAQLSAAARGTAALPGVTWKERGPKNVSGRTRAILVDPNDPTGRTIFAGSVAGGLWKTSDITLTEPNWTPVDDFFANLAVTSIAAQPGTPQVMYFGTGEGYFNSDAVRGNGVWKSTNGGTTWTQLASTTSATFNYCQRVTVSSTGTVLVATNGSGLQRSTNGGTSWTKVLGSGLGITGANSNIAWDVEIAANGDVYASLDGSIHKSTNGGATFAAAMTTPSALGRTEFGCAASDANYVYALVESGNVVSAILQSTDAGATWTTRTEPADADPGVGATDFSRGQAWYDLAIAVDPNNRNRLYVGGVDLFYSNDGAGTWTQASHWYGGFGFQYAHADQHWIVYQPGSSSIAYFGNDGGIYRTNNAQAATPVLDFKGQNYNVTQFYACAAHPAANSNYFLAGAQDNGTQRFSTVGINNTDEATGGDGAFCHIDQDQPQYQFTAYVYNDYFRSADNGATFTNVTSGSTGRFINPTDYDNVNNRLYAARNANQYLRWDNPQTGATFVSINLAAINGQVSAVKVSPNTANRVFFGSDGGTITRVDNAHTGTPTATAIDVAAMPNNYVSSIEVETGNDNHILVTYSNYGVNSVWETTNGGTAWTSIEGNLPDMPIRWILLNPDNPTQAVVATQLGVWTTDLLSGVATVWGPSNTGLANVRTDMLRLRASDKIVIAATHGRGLYSSDMFASPTALFDADKHVAYTGKPINFIDGSYRATSWSWDFGDGSPLSSAANPAHTYLGPGRYSVTLTINSGASTLTKTNFIQVLPDRGTPYAPADGGNFEANPDDFGPENWSGTPWQRGSSAIAGKNGTRSAPNAWVTGLTAPNYSDVNNVVLFAPSYNLTLAGTYTLSFYSKFNTEADYDGYRVEYSLNKGDTWTLLGTVGAGWYNFANTAAATAFPINEPFFSGNVSAAFNLYSRDISFLSGNANVAFRFVFKSDFSVTAPGVAIDDFSIAGPANPASGFPIEGSPLTGTWTLQGALLNWQTYQESGNRGFEIQRSEDGISFSAIGYVNGAGDSDSPNPYSFLDTKALGGSFHYRYRQQDFNGGESYSNVVLLTSGDADPALSAYPSPFQDELHIAWANWESGEISIQLTDLAGRQLAMQNGADSNGQLDLKGLSALPSGIYFLKLQQHGKAITRKLVH